MPVKNAIHRTDTKFQVVAVIFSVAAVLLPGFFWKVVTSPPQLKVRGCAHRRPVESAPQPILGSPLDGQAMPHGLWLRVVRPRLQGLLG